MSKLANTLKLIKLITGDEFIKSKYISEQLNIKARMIRIYVEDIKEAGIEVENMTGSKGGYRLNKKYLIDYLEGKDEKNIT